MVKVVPATAVTVTSSKGPVALSAISKRKAPLTGNPMADRTSSVSASSLRAPSSVEEAALANCSVMAQAAARMPHLGHLISTAPSGVDPSRFATRRLHPAQRTSEDMASSGTDSTCAAPFPPGSARRWLGG